MALHLLFSFCAFVIKNMVLCLTTVQGISQNSELEYGAQFFRILYTVVLQNKSEGAVLLVSFSYP